MAARGTWQAASTVLSSHRIPIIDARRLLGVVSFSPSPLAQNSLNVYTTCRSDVTSDRLGRTPRHRRRRLQQTQARRAPSIWRQFVTSRIRVASPSRVYVPCIRSSSVLPGLKTLFTHVHTYSDYHGGFLC